MLNTPKSISFPMYRKGGEHSPRPTSCGSFHDCGAEWIAAGTFTGLGGCADRGIVLIAMEVPVHVSEYQDAVQLRSARYTRRDSSSIASVCEKNQRLQ